jgi:hypothetical protein
VFKAILSPGWAFAGWCLLFANGMATARSPFIGQLVDPVLLRGIEDVYLDGDHVYLPCREGKRLTICTIKAPNKPQVISSFTHSVLSETGGMAVHGTTVFLTSMGNGRLVAVDVSDRSSARLLGSVAVVAPGEKGVLYKVAYRDGYCYVAHQSAKKLTVVDVRDPSQPAVVASVAVTTEDDGPFSVLFHGDYAFTGTIFGRRNRFAVVDVRDPLAPRLVNQLIEPSVAQASGEVVGKFFYGVYWDEDAFFVLNVADPANPRLVSRLIDTRLGKPNRCIVSGNRAYLPMGGGDGVAVVDISDPTQPRFLTAFRDPVMKKAYGAAVRGNLLLVGAREGNSLVVLNRRKLEP